MKRCGTETEGDDPCAHLTPFLRTASLPLVASLPDGAASADAHSDGLDDARWPAIRHHPVDLIAAVLPSPSGAGDPSLLAALPDLTPWLRTGGIAGCR
jgi:hypothetical protein